MESRSLERKPFNQSTAELTSSGGRGGGGRGRKTLSVSAKRYRNVWYKCTGKNKIVLWFNIIPVYRDEVVRQYSLNNTSHNNLKISHVL